MTVRFRRILCPVDFFPASLRAYDYALKLAAHYEARLHALHVVAPVIQAAYYGSSISVPDMTAELEKESKELLQKLKTKAEGAQVPIQIEVRIGDIDVEILHAIEARKADLVVMGTHGRRGFERWFMGSVTERMLRHCPVPLLAMGAAKTRKVPPAIRRILVTTDFSGGTTDAVAYAFSIAQECRAKVTFLHVVNDLTLGLGQKLSAPLITSIREELDKLVPANIDSTFHALFSNGLHPQNSSILAIEEKFHMNWLGPRIVAHVVTGVQIDRLEIGDPGAAEGFLGGTRHGD